jgi:hypothetical protein
MAFPFDDQFLGPDNFGPLRGHEGIIWHTTEGGGFSRADAVSTARYQLTHLGSYNFIIYDGGVLLTVPPAHASGGINPASPAWAPSRFPFLKASLSAAAYANPTMYHLQVSFSGKRSEMDAGRMPANMLDTAIRLRDWWERTVARRVTLQSGHMHWQTNRSDPGKVYTKLTRRDLPDTAQEEEMIDAKTHVPVATVDILAGGSVYADEKRTKLLIPSLGARTAIGLYAMPVDPSGLAAIGLNLAGAGQPRDYQLVWIGADKVVQRQGPAQAELDTLRTAVAKSIIDIKALQGDLSKCKAAQAVALTKIANAIKDLA